MTTKQRRPGPTPLDPSGERMKPRQIRMTDAQAEDLKMVGHERVRQYVTKTAQRMRKEGKK